ncbi:hypothetical protein [Photobacterium sp. GB-36]|uniref:hypothetical protein n=1 Tax=Photobacterium sp. GB-36 TaxID=2022108 RepID=UPI000D16BE4D|nr:hypothetical protein [Photobacterium sp. GB-36]PSV38634.1 hypothetical protein C9J46_20770 [Photobacterium sp. GB-36]
MTRTIKYWQHAAGDQDRNYVDLCLKWDVIITGPGYQGAWPDCAEKLKKNEWSSRKVTNLKRFCETIIDRDIVVLRLGTSQVYGVGMVVGDYEYNENFGDVDGWGLQHIRRVKWLWKYNKNPKNFDTYSLKLGDTTQELTSDIVINWIHSLKLDFDSLPTLTKLPQVNVQKDICFENISESLFDYGVSSTSIDVLTKEIDELIRIAKWYQKYQDPSEFETVAYLAVPLLRALGWTPQKMAIEWNKVDIALFKRLPRNDSNLDVVVEAKRKGNSCLNAISQAEGYAQGKENCKRLIVTDGLRYGVYLKDGENFKLYAYFNITRIRESYPIYECGGASMALKAMTPEWQGEI